MCDCVLCVVFFQHIDWSLKGPTIYEIIVIILTSPIFRKLYYCMVLSSLRSMFSKLYVHGLRTINFNWNFDLFWCFSDHLIQYCVSIIKFRMELVSLLIDLKWNIKVWLDLICHFFQVQYIHIHIHIYSSFLIRVAKKQNKHKFQCTIFCHVVH